MECADGVLYQQDALSRAKIKAGFPHQGLTCFAITPCLPRQSVVLLCVTELRAYAFIGRAQYSWFLANSAHTIRAFLLASATAAMLLFLRSNSRQAQLDSPSCFRLTDCKTALAPWISKVLK